MIVVLYGVLLLAMGFYFRRRAERGASGFFLAGRSLGAAEVGLSLAATGFGGSALLVASKLAWTQGLGAAWMTGSIAVGFCVMGLFFARRVRAGGACSLAHYIRLHCGVAAGWLASLLIVTVQTAWLGLTIKSFTVLCSPLLPAGHWLIASPLAFTVLVTAVIAVYTLAGGHKAVAATDLVQLGLIALVLVGWLWPAAAARADFSQLPAGLLHLPWPAQGGPWFALNMTVMMGLSGVVGGDLFSKILSARDGRAAARGAIIGGAGLALLTAAVVGLALCARVLLPGLENPALAIPALARHLGHPWVFQLVCLALLSVLLSTADSVLMTGATVLTLDVLGRGEQTRPAVIRALTLGLAAVGLGLALFFGGVLEIMKFAYTLLTASLVVPTIFVMALGERRPPQGWFIAATAGGLAAALVWALATARGWLVSPLDPAVAGAAVGLTVMSVGSIYEFKMRNREPRTDEIRF